DGGGARTDDADPLAREVDALVRPVARVEHAASKCVAAREVRDVRRRQAPGRHDAEPGRDPLTVGGLHPPAIRGLVEDGGPNARVQLDVPAEVEAVDDVVDVLHDLGLRRVALAPLPLLLELFGELVGILHALDVAAGAGIAIPEPRAADAASGLEDARREPEAAEPVQHAHAGEPGAHDHRIEVSHSIYLPNASA